MSRTPGRLLWLDAMAAAVAGLLVLLLSGWLSELYRLPRPQLLFIGAVNLLYASYAFSLTQRRDRSLPWVIALVAANSAWACACLVMAWRVAGDASAFALLHLIGEAIFVGGLAAWEWRWRHLLVQPHAGTAPAATARRP